MNQIPSNSTVNSKTVNTMNQPVQTPSSSTAKTVNATNQSVQTPSNSTAGTGFVNWLCSIADWVENLLGLNETSLPNLIGNFTDEEDFEGNGTARRLLVDSNSTGINRPVPVAPANATGLPKGKANCTNSQSCGGDHDSFQGTGINADNNAGSNASPSPSSTQNVKNVRYSGGAILYASPLVATMWLLV